MRGLLAKYKFNGEMNSCVVVVPFTKSADLRDEKYSRCWKNNTHTTQFSCLMKDLLGKMTGQSFLQRLCTGLYDCIMVQYD